MVLDLLLLLELYPPLEKELVVHEGLEEVGYHFSSSCFLHKLVYIVLLRPELFLFFLLLFEFLFLTSLLVLLFSKGHLWTLAQLIAEN